MHIFGTHNWVTLVLIAGGGYIGPRLFRCLRMCHWHAMSFEKQMFELKDC